METYDKYITALEDADILVMREDHAKVEVGNAMVEIFAMQRDVYEETDKTDIVTAMRTAGMTVDANKSLVEIIASEVINRKIASDDNADAIDTAESRITVTEGAIESKVSKNGVVSAINQTAETIKISASKINLDGYVTASNLAATISDLGYVDISQASIDQLTVSDYLRFDGHNAKWKSKEVVTGASNSTLSNVAIADENNNVVSRVKLYHVKAANLETDTIYYLGY